MATHDKQAPKELTLTRTFDAPRELVFETWTRAEHLAKWWGPKGFTCPVCEVDLRPGGAIRITMQDADGTLYPSNGTFQEIEPPEQLVFISTGFEDKDGRPTLEVINTVTFEAVGKQTHVTLHARVVRSTPEIAWAIGGMDQGWTDSLDKLAALLEEG